MGHCRHHGDHVEADWQSGALVLRRPAGTGDEPAKIPVTEGPAVPLATRRQIVKPLTATAYAALVADQLAVNLLTVMATPITPEQRERLTQSFFHDGQVQWPAVDALFSPLGYQIQGTPDDTTREWLNGLLALTVADFHH